jgi:hypothetical protein
MKPYRVDNDGREITISDMCVCVCVGIHTESLESFAIDGLDVGIPNWSYWIVWNVLMLRVLCVSYHF